MSFIRTVEPAAEPVTLDEQRAQMLIPDTLSEDDDFIENDCIKTAREIVEEETWRALMTQTWRLNLMHFSDSIPLPRPPLQGVSSITYIDLGGAEQTLPTSFYTVLTDDVPGRICRAYGQSWPAVRCVPNAIKITYVAGFASADAVPSAYKKAIKLLAADFYEHREESTPLNLHKIPVGVQRILAPLKVRHF